MTKYQTHEAHVVRLETDIVRLRAINAKLRKSIQAPVQPDTKLKQAARQALEALERPRDQNSWYTRACSDADAAKNLREALETLTN